MKVIFTCLFAWLMALNMSAQRTAVVTQVQFYPQTLEHFPVLNIDTTLNRSLNCFTDSTAFYPVHGRDDRSPQASIGSDIYVSHHSGILYGGKLWHVRGLLSQKRILYEPMKFHRGNFVIDSSRTYWYLGYPCYRATYTSVDEHCYLLVTDKVPVKVTTAAFWPTGKWSVLQVYNVKYKYYQAFTEILFSYDILTVPDKLVQKVNDPGDLALTKKKRKEI